MYFRYGSYQHPDNEAKLMSFVKNPHVSERGKRYVSRLEMHIQIEVVLPTNQSYTTAEAQLYLNNRILELINVYKSDYQDAIFYHDDGTPTQHKLINGGSVSGVRVKHQSWPRGDAAEYATTRTAYIILTADYTDIYSEIYSYSEVVRNIGTGGPRWRMQEFVSGIPIMVVLNQQTAQKIVQSGTAVGVEGYPLPYMLPLWPAYEHLDMREVTPGTPTHYGQGLLLYPLTWTFHFTLPSGSSTFPNIQ